MNNIFTHVPSAREQSNMFDLSHDVKMTLSMGKLVPTLLTEVLPGDKFYIRSENLLRFFPLVSPVMHRVKVTVHYFFVPNRILWPNWEKYITGDLEVQPPQSDYGHFAGYKGSLYDYMGVPPLDEAADTEPINMLPFAAYAKIYNEYYRDQNLVTPIIDECNDGDDNDDLFTQSKVLQKRAWNHDYLTSCLPSAQKGEEVTLPLIQGGPLPVDQEFDLTGSDQPRFVKPDGTSLAGADNTVKANAAHTYTEGDVGQEAVWDFKDSLTVNINDEAATINTLRRAYKLQEWLERNARGGTRYNEHISSHFGVKSSDQRMQRPEYIGGMKQNMVISEVLSTAETLNTENETINPVGQMAGHGISAGGSDTKTYYAEEHGFIIGIMNVQPTTSYSEGLPRLFSRQDKLDYYWPSFANIGEQEVLKKEVRMANIDVTRNQVFGYIPRYAEYKYLNSRVAAEMRDTLQSWHWAREISGVPVLNQEFIECTPRKNMFAVIDESEDEIIAHVINHVKAKRKMPVFGTPTI